MPLVFWFSVVLLSVFLRNEEGDINTHKQTHILGDAYLSWPWGAGWPIWSSSWGAGVLCCAVSAWAVLQVTNPRSYHDKLCTLTWVCSCPLQAWPKPSLALLSSHCLLCSPGPLSSPSHVPLWFLASWRVSCVADRTQPLLSWAAAGSAAAGADATTTALWTLPSFTKTQFYLWEIPKLHEPCWVKCTVFTGRNLFYRVSQFNTKVFFCTIWRCPNRLLFCYPTDLIVFSGACRNWFCQH